MLSRNLDGKTGIPLADALPLIKEIREAQATVTQLYEERNYAGVTRLICQLADKANKYVEDQAPWTLIKKDTEAARGVLTAALECGRILTLYLKPILPTYAEKVEACLRLEPMKWSDAVNSMPSQTINPFEHLITRIDERRIQAMLQDNSDAALPPTGAPSTDPAAAGTAAAPVHAAATAAIEEPLAPTCTIDQFAAVDLRVARVLEASAVTESDKLMRLVLDAGPLGKRNILAGIKKAYTAEELTGRLVIFCANLAPRKMKFGVSEGMILASGPGGAEVFLLAVDSKASPGQRVH